MVPQGRGWARTAAAQAERDRQVQRQTFKVHAESRYRPWAKQHHRGYRTTRSQVTRLVAAFTPHMLDEITTADIERHSGPYFRSRPLYLSRCLQFPAFLAGREFTANTTSPVPP
jgi:hypothetical protein